MWRNLSKQASLRKYKLFSESYPLFSSLRAFQPSQVSEKIRDGRGEEHAACMHKELGFAQSSHFSRGDFGVWSNFPGIFGTSRGYASVAEALASTSEEDVDEVQELIEEMDRHNEETMASKQQKQPKTIGGMGVWRYNVLKKRQIKIETEAWEEAAKEYQELLTDMCEQKLAPNLPYVKSLFLGWFEPLKDAIAAEQTACLEGKIKLGHVPFFTHLPAEMMAVITMHKLMGLLMTGSGHGSTRVVQAACHIGEAIENEVSSILNSECDAM